MNNSKQRIAQSKHYLAPLGEIDARTQFGGYSLAVEKIVFAVVAEGELYLRACEQIQPYIGAGRMPRLIFHKRGMPVSLNYFRVDEALWAQPETLLALSRSALKRARQQLQEKVDNLRVKDLPNMGLRLEMMLRAVGICTVQSLRAEGSKQCWLKLKAAHKNLGINTLFALEGAITGRHQAALPDAVQQELRDWFNHNVDLRPE
ncbi:TfoX/Sxy family DNA transformation protein [Erwiniaceae bacterium BAC15a-03b]|uniref:TfoX/Sxy family DNA transformation protein n=1 Tax=Winslowiella arboricola TaxID=2978220 RepID=A0A9J6PZQ5_9GAMM|nr:TfoX/Sxy family DNA transformation protein [Winslowiella arboricola]MCU5775150.1 TfoX/Sxy family DNA transformation protein [Winslowiella arboricola]MCU5780396.1 TfoX/Sxy family DNA transformation protein [Winslowiella arboricola]